MGITGTGEGPGDNAGDVTHCCAVPEHSKLESSVVAVVLPAGSKALRLSALESNASGATCLIREEHWPLTSTCTAVASRTFQVGNAARPTAASMSACLVLTGMEEHPYVIHERKIMPLAAETHSVALHAPGDRSVTCGPLGC